VPPRASLPTLLVAAAVFALFAWTPWHDEPSVRRAAAIVAATLLLWISEVAPLGVIALGIPVAATLTGILKWDDALAVWGDPIIFLNLGAFLLARALDKHGAFDWLRSPRWWGSSEPAESSRPATRGPLLLVMAVAGLISTVQNNTAVTAMLLPVVASVARRSGSPAAMMMALSLGATFGGMATPIGTAPNFIGYAAMKRIDPSVSFLTWARVGLVVWAGTTLVAWAVLAVAARFAPMARGGASPMPGRRWVEPQVGLEATPQISEAQEDAAERARGRRYALLALSAAAAVWIGSGIVIGVSGEADPRRLWVQTYLPESLVPVAVAGLLFIVRTGPRGRAVLDRRDFQTIDWDTIFLFGGGLCLGKMLTVSGAARALVDAVALANVAPLALLLAIAVVTVLLSEVTSNTATAVLMVPIAASLGPVLEVSATKVIWIVALSASLGFALPVSTPPNALVYGTRLVPLRWMAAVGLTVDLLSVLFVVACVLLLG
jgi:sodium-dependent dicarboxylate transporter 2/3/5